MSCRSGINKKKSLQVILSIIFLLGFCISGFSQENRNPYSIELESEGAYTKLVFGRLGV